MKTPENQEVTTLHGMDKGVQHIIDGVFPFVIEAVPFHFANHQHMRGLEVFAVIAGLREHDEEFHGVAAVLDEDAQRRLSLLERAVDEAVELRNHYFPFGHKSGDEYQMPAHDFRQLSGSRQEGAVITGKLPRPKVIPYR